MKKAAIYMRVSTANQEKEETIENQRMELDLRLAKEKESVQLLTDCIYEDDGWSGLTLERPALDQMRADASEKKFDILYVYDRGRIARKFLLQEIVLDELRSHGIETTSLHDISGESDEERLMGGVMGIFHEYERLKITERMRIGKLRKVRENKKLLGYSAKYGYDYIPKIKGVRDGKFVINEEQALVVRQIFAWAADGWSKYRIRDGLYERGIMPAKAKRNIWSLDVINRMLTDSTYMGEHYYNKTESIPTKNPRKIEKYRRTLKGSRKTRPKDEWLMVKVPVIVEPGLFKQVQKQLKQNKRYRSNNKKHNYLVGGVIECVCGFSRTGEVANKCFYYRCNDRLNNVAGTRTCYEKSVNATVLDDLVWSNVKELLSQPELVFAQAKRWQESSSPLQEKLKILQKRLKDLEAKEDRFGRMYGQGDHVMTERVYKENMSELNETRRQIIDDITATNDEMKNKPTLPLEELVEGVIKLVERLDFANKRQIVQKVISKVVATKKEVTVWGFIPVLATEKVGLNVKYRYCWIAERREVDVI